MIKEREAPFRAVRRLRITSQSPQSVELIGKTGSIHVSVLAADLIRLRIVRGRNFSAIPSWAVHRTDWPMVDCQIEVINGILRIRTSQGTFRISLISGQWEVTGSEKVTRLQSIEGQTGFVGASGRIALRTDPEESFFGLGETTGPLNKIGSRRELWNIDVLGHAPGIHPGLRSLYASIPFAISMRHGVASGIFWDNPTRQVWDFGEKNPGRLDISADSGEIDLYLFLGPKLNVVVSRYTELTGRMPLPPLWGLGYHQSRYSYESGTRVAEIAREFRKRRIPCDAIYLDIHYMNGYRVFSFGKRFPKPAQLMKSLARNGFRVVAIVDPGVKNDRRFGVLNRGIALRAFVKTARGGRDYVGKVWPGASRFPDFTRARVREWWGREQAALQRSGIGGFWNDMNEPANFALPSKTLPEDSVHHSDHGVIPHRIAHNIYGMQMARASWEGAARFNPRERPFVISRAGYAGIQRHALLWTGDNSSYWEHLAESIPMLLNLSLSGVAFCGADVGGFMENCGGELLARWTQMAAFTPFFRNHSNLGTRAQEPWAHGPKIEAICKAAIEFRYQLLPYLFCLFAEAHRSGTPIMRPVFWNHENDSTALGVSDQFMLGPSLLIAPILRPGGKARSVYLPQGIWHALGSGQSYKGREHILALAELDRIPVYVRAGSIIPMCPVQQYTDEKPWSTITLHVWPGADGELTWCEDLPYDLDGIGSTRKIDLTGQRLIIEPETMASTSKVKVWRIIWRTARRPLHVRKNGQSIKSRFEPALGLCATEVLNGNSSIEISWR